MSQALNQLKGILAKHSLGSFSVEEISADRPVFGIGGVITESLRILDALCDIEAAFGLSIPDDDLTEDLFASVASLTNYVTSRVSTE